jgi:hypothetical protein
LVINLKKGVSTGYAVEVFLVRLLRIKSLASSLQLEDANCCTFLACLDSQLESGGGTIGANFGIEDGKFSTEETVCEHFVNFTCSRRTYRVPL